MSTPHLRILLVGKGGREHALAWKLCQSPLVEHIYVVPGNGGTARGLENVSHIEGVRANDYPKLVELSQKLQINLVVAGPDDAVVDGIEGHFREVGIACFAPTKAAAKLEGSKTFAKDFMQRHKIPTAEYRNFSDYRSAKEYLASTSHPVVIKVSGLAAGKGVIVPSGRDEAQAALKTIMVDGKFGDAGSSVVIEEFLDGDEISVLTFSDGKTTKSLPAGQDHKRIFDGDKGPNTGGMGVYVPAPIVTPSVMEEIEKTILKPTFDGLTSEGLTFVGMLFTGIMLTASGPKVLEYNVRFGDPETQSMIPLLRKETDLAEVMVACTEGRLDQVKIAMSSGFCANVVITAGGYPEAYAQGDVVEFGPIPERVIVFHAGTKLVGDQILTAGGRVFAVAATGETLEEAVATAYKGVDSIRFRNMFYRKDIAYRALNRY